MKQESFLGLSEEGFHRITYSEWGAANPAFRSMICVHGLTRNRHDFDDFANYLSTQGRHVFCPDIVGRGDSAWLKDPLHYTYEQYFADMTALIARTQATEIDWFGISMGGLIGMALAAQPNTPIRRLIMNDIGPQIPVKALQRLAKYTGHDPDFSSIDQAKKYYKAIYADFGPLTDEQWYRLAQNSIREVAPGRYISKLDHGVKAAPAKSKLAWKLLFNPHKALEGTVFDVDLWHLWRKIKCPVLVIRGKNSDMLLPSIVTKMQRIHPATTLLEIDNAGHAPAMLERHEHEQIMHWLNTTA